MKGLTGGRGYTGQPLYMHLRYHPLLLAGVLFVSLTLARADVPPVASPNVDCKIVHAVKPVYPFRLMNDGVRHGAARIGINVDSSGRLTDALIVAYTHQEFGEVALEAIRQWTFEPGRINGEAVSTVMEVTFEFEIENGFALIKQHTSMQEDAQLQKAREKYVYQADSLRDLDHIPMPVHVSDPEYPKDWEKQGIVGTVVVEFYIDETGKARLPLAPKAPNAMLAATALATVRQWQFDPPTCKGHPVLVRTQTIFTFGGDKK